MIEKLSQLNRQQLEGKHINMTLRMHLQEARLWTVHRD